MHKGKCHCGGVEYMVEGEAAHAALCHCRDCVLNAGAAPVAWAMFANTQFKITKGETKIYNSSGNVERHFCAHCGTGLFYINEDVLPGMVDVKITTLDNPQAFAPKVHIQTAERIEWVKDMHTLPEFERFPSC